MKSFTVQSEVERATMLEDAQALPKKKAFF